MSRALVVPPLPAGWPFRLRATAAFHGMAQGAALPGLGDGWSLRLRAPLEGLAGGEPAALAFGRGGARRCGDLVLRPYRRGGLVRLVNERIYPTPARFARELAVHTALWEAGFPTVEPLGYAFRRCGWGVEGIYLTRFEAAIPWPAAWAANPGLPSRVAALLRALAAWGLLAPDLNATNFLVTPRGEVLALDWDRAAWTRRGGLLARYAARLARSLRKLGAPPELLEELGRALSPGAGSGR